MAISETLTGKLATRGFAVVRGFMPSDLVETFARDHRSGAASANKAYSLGLPGAEAMDQLRPLIERQIAIFQANPGFSPTRIGGGVFFAVGNGINFGWHQDHESYFIHQTHRHYLNVYIPVVKPERAKSNLSIVPADNFAEAMPTLWARLEGRGAATFRQEGDRLSISDDWAGGLIGEPVTHLDNIAETPTLDAGDALLMRGDLFHRTQDTDTPRVALSVRVSDDTHTVTRAHFAQTCETKDWFLQQNAPMYDAIRAVFARHESLPLQDLLREAFALRA